jgi:hypothetical protein
MITFELTAQRADDRKSEPSLAASAVFHAMFEPEEGATEQDWLAYTSTSMARNVALQAAAVCQRQFRQQIGLTGIPPDKLLFGKLGAFDRGEVAEAPAARKRKHSVKTKSRI